MNDKDELIEMPTLGKGYSPDQVVSLKATFARDTHLDGGRPRQPPLRPMTVRDLAHTRTFERYWGPVRTLALYTTYGTRHSAIVRPPIRTTNQSA